MRSASEYRAQMQALLPPGRLWDALRANGSLADELLAALAEEFTRVDSRADDLLDEADPRTALELLEEWEAWAGLPDICTGGMSTLQERRAELIQRLTGVGGQSRAYFIALATSLGYAITIDEFRPFVCGGSMCGEQLNGGAESRFYWRVNVGAAKVVRFLCGGSQCGDSLGKIYRAESLECLLNRLKPAHTIIIFNYSGV